MMRGFEHLPEGWQTCIRVFLQSVLDRSGSRQSYESYAGVLLRFFRTHHDPDAVTKSDVLAFMQSPCTSRRNHGGEASASTRNSRRCTLTSLYKFASEFTVEGGKPLYQKPLPTQGLRNMKPATNHRVLEVAELERLFAVIGEGSVKALRDRALYMFYLYTTRRRRELASIQWGAIAETTIIEEGRARPAVIFRYRQKGTYRTVKTQEMPRPVYDAIVRYLVAAGRFDGMTATTPIFVSTNPWHATRMEPLDDNYMNTMLKGYLEAAGLDREISLHALRHSAARIRYLSGQSLLSIKETLGHASIQTTFNYIGALTGVGDPMARTLETGAFAFLGGH